ncbi:hypothetical protein [Bacillus alkalicellulosilyticus]|uniref:hypothetical protein n=1 Tax=Alkalihalobacterium alkalicellulosilyticum TaxID=1912214 RepID=UPI000997D209|nr:hypothetical protein [Bacillus alkalicellulosilyticus]
MTYQMDKQLAFQTAQQAVVQAQDAVAEITPSAPDAGHDTKIAMQEIEEAEVQIQKALTVCTEHQKVQLGQFQDQLDQLKSQIH